MTPLQLRQLMLTSILSIALIWTPALSLAQRSPTSSPIQFTPPTPPPNIGEPTGRGQGGGSRGPACQPYEGITALVPVVSATALPWGLTTADHPTVWLYAPQGLAANVPVEFVLQDETGQRRYRALMRATEMPTGIFSVSVPPTAAPLEVGQSYRWSVSIYCDSENPDVPFRVQGALQHTAQSADLQRQLAAAQNPVQKAALYAQNGVWYDALTTLAEHRRQTEEEAIAAVWTDLLQQANLGQFAAAPIEACCREMP